MSIALLVILWYTLFSEYARAPVGPESEVRTAEAETDTNMTVEITTTRSCWYVEDRSDPAVNVGVHVNRARSIESSYHQGNERWISSPLCSMSLEKMTWRKFTAAILRRFDPHALLIAYGALTDS